MMNTSQMVTTKNGDQTVPIVDPVQITQSIAQLGSMINARDIDAKSYNGNAPPVPPLNIQSLYHIRTNQVSKTSLNEAVPSNTGIQKTISEIAEYLTIKQMRQKNRSSFNERLSHQARDRPIWKSKSRQTLNE